MSKSPGLWVTGSLSPVSRDSSAAHTPSAIMASAGIWSPALKTARSPSTRSSGGHFCSRPSRITRASRTSSSRSLFSMARARSSCTVPISVLENTTPRNSMFFQEPTSARQKARAKFSRLNRVNRLSATMRGTLFPGSAVCRLLCPAAARWAASAWVSPSLGVGTVPWGGAVGICSAAFAAFFSGVIVSFMYVPSVYQFPVFPL